MLCSVCGVRARAQVTEASAGYTVHVILYMFTVPGRYSEESNLCKMLKTICLTIRFIPTKRSLCLLRLLPFFFCVAENVLCRLLSLLLFGVCFFPSALPPRARFFRHFDSLHFSSNSHRSSECVDRLYCRHFIRQL